MSLWIGGKEVGLAPGQTSGEVGGVNIVRPEYSDPSQAYIIGTEPVVGELTMGYQSRTKISGYDPMAGIGERIVYVTTTEKPPTKASDTYEQTRTIPTPFETGYVQYAPGSPFGTGYFTSPEYQKPSSQSQLPSYLFGRSEDEFRVLPRFGQVYPQDIAEGLRGTRTEQTYKSLLPSDIGLSEFSRGFYEGAAGISEGIRGFTIGTGGLPKEIRESPGMGLGTFVFQRGRESTARLSEFVGTIPGTTEIWGKTTISKPTALPGMLVYGGIEVATGIGKQAKSDPFQLLSDVIVTTGAFKLAGKTTTRITEPIKFMGKKYVPAETIIEPQVLSGAERFPLAPRGTTGAQLVREFERGKYRMPGTEGKIGGWHATPEAFAKETLTKPGTSEGMGLYIAPSTSPHFWKIGGGQLKLFGWGEAPTSPTGIWLETGGIKRSPGATRYSIELQNMFLQQKASKGTGFISAAFEKGIKPEKEAIIPPETPITRISNKFYTKYMGKHVPLMEYTAVQKPLVDLPFESPFDFTGGGHVVTVTRGKGGMVLAAPLVMGGFKTRPQKEETFGELAQRQFKISSEYSRYKEPIFTPSSLVSSFRSGYRAASMSSIKPISSYPKFSISRQRRYFTGYSGISTPKYPVITSNIYSPGRTTYISKTGYPGKTTYPGYPSTPTTPFTITTTKIKPKASIDLFPGMRKRKGRRTGFKFPEISGVASPKQIMKGFRL